MLAKQLHQLRCQLWAAERRLDRADHEACELRAKIAKLSYQICTPVMTKTESDFLGSLNHRLPETQRDQ